MSDHDKNPQTHKERYPGSRFSMRNPSVNWRDRFAFPRSFLNILERFSLAFEKPINRFVKDGRFNPLYHTGTITLFLLFIILGTGIYLTMFYQFGFESSYDSIGRIEDNFIGRIVRALHKYASGAAVIFALLHGWRTFFQDRFRGPRWLAWTTGVGMAAFVWLIGISGYWLVWDERAAVLNQTLISLINNSQLGTNFLVNYLVTPSAGSGWIFMVLVITVHLGLSAFVGLFYWWHIKRLSRPKWLPPNYWMASIAVLLVMASVFFPVGMLSSIDPTRLPENITIDLFYLFYLPGGLNQPYLFWGVILLIIGVTSLLPWILTRKTNPPIIVDGECCTGCTLCAADCPYKAIQMVERADNKKHKYIAIIDSKLCVGCGVCIGTCAPLALTLGDSPAQPLWEETLSFLSKKSSGNIKLVFTCERHATQGALPDFRSNTTITETGSPIVQVIPLTCVAMAHPNLVVKALEVGANEIQFIGCPPEDCANREGNLWMQDRLERQRLPRLKSSYSEAKITSNWLPPNEFQQGLTNPNSNREATGYRINLGKSNWKNIFPALILFGLLFLAQIWISDIDYQPFPSKTAMLEFSLNHKAGYPLKQIENNSESILEINHPTQLVLEVDGHTLLDQTYTPQGSSKASIAFEQFPLPEGVRHIKLTMFDQPNQNKGIVLFDKPTYLSQYQILRIDYSDNQLNGDPFIGESLFYDRSIGAGGSCSLCHSLNPEEALIGPSLSGVARRAAERVPGMSAEAYLKQSILEPDAYIVEGFPAGQMLPDLGEKLKPEQINHLVAFLLTLK